MAMPNNQTNNEEAVDMTLAARRRPSPTKYVEAARGFATRELLEEEFAFRLQQVHSLQSLIAALALMHPDVLKTDPDTMTVEIPEQFVRECESLRIEHDNDGRTVTVRVKR